MRKSLRIMMHALAVFLLLVAAVTPVFWVRSRTRTEAVWVQWNSVAYLMGSWNSQACPSLQSVPAGPLKWEGDSGPLVPGARDAWSYTAIGRDPRDPDHLFNFLGVAVLTYPGRNDATIPDSYLLLFSLSVPAWWFWRVRRQRQTREGGFPVEAVQDGESHKAV